jgi:hypothetical protein
MQVPLCNDSLTLVALHLRALTLKGVGALHLGVYTPQG